MISIKGRIYIDITIDGRPLPYSPNLVDRITMTEGGAAMSPAIEIMFNDYSGMLNRELALTDGNEILITVGKSPEDIKTISRQYRLFGMRSITTAFGPRIQAVGLYDAPGYLTGTAREAYKGSTGDVLKQVAEKCKLCYDGPEDFNGKTMNDTQVWRNVCKSRAVFVQEITRHAYLNESSTMTAMLTSLGKLMYRNLSDVIETPIDKIQRVFVHNIDQAFIKENNLTAYEVREARSRSTAGLMNTWQNYGSTRVEHSLSGESAVHDKVDVSTSSEYLPINDTVKKTVERTRIEYTPLDSGNTHKNYQKAMYQNLKLMGLFCEYVSLLTLDVTDVQLLDPVLYRQANADFREPLSISDVYIVVAKTVFVKGGSVYAERLELVRRSLPNKGATELSCAPTPSQSAASAVPDSVIDPTSTVTSQSLPRAAAFQTMGQPTQAAFDRIKATTPDMRKATSYAMPPINGMTNSIRGIKSGASMNPLQALNAVNAMRGALPSLRHFSDIGKQMSYQMMGATSQLSTLRSALKSGNTPLAIRSALMFRPSGIMNSFTSSMSSTKQQMQMNSVLRPIARTYNANAVPISQVPGGTEALQEFNDVHQQIIANGSSCQVETTRQWNQSVSILSAQPIPNSSSIRQSNSDHMTSVMSNLYRAPGSGSTPCVPLSTATDDVTKIMMSKGGDRQLPFVPENDQWKYNTSVTEHASEWVTVDVTPVTGTDSGPPPSYEDSVEAADAAYLDLDNEQKLATLREQDLYNTTWA